MKKFLMYTVVLITMLFIGYTAYYFIRNNETISLTLAEGEEIYLNKDDTYELPISWIKPYSSTKVYENVEIGDESVVSFNSTTKLLTAVSGGKTFVKIVPSNKEFGPFQFDINVGDGSIEFPYYIQKDSELADIGNIEKFTLTNSYILVKDINLDNYENWSPIGTDANPFMGTFNGNGKKVSNLKITSGGIAGLFGCVATSGNVSNVVLNKPVVSGSFDYAGAVVGKNYGTIRHCEVVDFELTNSNETSYNGGICGASFNTTLEGALASVGYVDLCTVSVSSECSGVFGGFVGQLVGSVVINSKCTITNYKTTDKSTYFGGFVGVLQDATGLTRDDSKGQDRYMFAVIKNCYEITTEANVANLSTKVGYVVGNNVDSCKSGYTNKLTNLYFQSTLTNNIVAESATTINTSSVYSKTLEELAQEETFKNWNFDSIWTTAEDTTLCYIKEDAVSEPLNEYIPGAEIQTDEDFKKAIEALCNAPHSGTVFVVKNNVTLDLDGAEWTTVCPDSNNPLNCSIICDDGVTATIKNAKITSKQTETRMIKRDALTAVNGQSSFFGYMSGVNTIMKGLVFENITVNTNAEIVGVIATGLLDNALLDTCRVNNSNITCGSSTKIVGVVAGTNRGIIKNCIVNEDADELNTVTATGDTLTIGGIVGEAYSIVENSSIYLYEFNTPNDNPSSSYIFGGIVGYVYGTKVVNCHNIELVMQTQRIGSVYAGGVCGYILSGATIDKSFSESIIEAPYSLDKSYVAGICAYASDSTIIRSYFAGIKIEGYYAAGICANSSSEITQSYFKNGAINGVRVGGLVVFNNKLIRNCFADGTVKGFGTSSNVSGICSTLPVGSKVENCFINIDFSACEGTKLAETEAQFRITDVGHWVGGLFDRYPETGTLTNCIIINYGDAIRQGSTLTAITQFNAYVGWIDCTNDEALGLSGNYSKFKNDAQFDQGVWTFDNNQGEGAYPTLTYCVVKEQ